MNVFRKISEKRSQKRAIKFRGEMKPLTKEQHEFLLRGAALQNCTAIRINGNGRMGEALRVIDRYLEPLEPIQTTEELDYRAGVATGTIYEMAATEKLDERQRDLALHILNSKYEIMRKARGVRFVI